MRAEDIVTLFLDNFEKRLSHEMVLAFDGMHGKFQEATFLSPKWPSLSLEPFKGPKKSRAPRKVSILCKGTI